jgi:hypothetical protein
MVHLLTRISIQVVCQQSVKRSRMSIPGICEPTPLVADGASLHPTGREPRITKMAVLSGTLNGEEISEPVHSPRFFYVAHRIASLHRGIVCRSYSGRQVEVELRFTGPDLKVADCIDTYHSLFRLGHLELRNFRMQAPQELCELLPRCDIARSSQS